jgi:lipopolysaccharide export system protein LptA
MRVTIAVLAVLAFAAPASAQQKQQPQQPQSSVTSAFSGFSTRSDEPTNIEADNLEVRDQQQAAIFSGNVLMKQGISTLKSHKLTIYYYDKSNRPPAAPATTAKQGETNAPGAAATPESGREIRRMEAEGDVVVTQNDQTATGQRGVFDTQANTAELFGGVVVSQNDNVIRGDRLHVDLTTQTSRVESGSAGRVQGIFKPRQQANAR